MFTAIMAVLNWKSFVEAGGKAFGWCIEHWKELTVATMFATIIYQNIFETRYVFGVNTIPYLQSQLEAKNKEIVDLHAAVDTIALANKTLTDAIEKTNMEIDQWKDVSTELEKKNAALSGELRGVRRSTRERVENILKDPTPVDCKAAIDYLRDSIPEIKFGRQPSTAKLP